MQPAIKNQPKMGEYFFRIQVASGWLFCDKRHKSCH